MFGNTANTLYQIAKALRARSTFDIHLFVDDRHNPVMLPESDDPELRAGYPLWIHRGRYLGPRCYLMPWTSPVVRELSAFDLVIVAGEGPIFAQFTGRPWCFLATGGDLTMLPFPRRFGFRHRGRRAKAIALVLAFWQRRALHRATEIWSQPFRPFRLAIDRLGLRPERVSPDYFPYGVDGAAFADDDTLVTDPVARTLRADHDFILFHPSRLMISAEPALRDAGQWKRNDLLLRAFARLVASGATRRPVLLMPDRTDSPDVAAARVLVRELGIEDSVVWLRPPRSNGYTRSELVHYYRIADVVADDFGAGWFGAVALETLAAGRPLVTHVDEAAMRILYPWHPMLSVATEDGVVDALLSLARDPVRRREIGLRGRVWIREFHTGDAIADRYLRNVEGVTRRLGLAR